MEKGFMWGVYSEGGSGKDIKEIISYIEGFNLIGRRYLGQKQEGVNYIFYYSGDTFVFFICFWCEDMKSENGSYVQ